VRYDFLYHPGFISLLTYHPKRKLVLKSRPWALRQTNSHVQKSTMTTAPEMVALVQASTNLAVFPMFFTLGGFF
jgi:hypothetical protein